MIEEKDNEIKKTEENGAGLIFGLDIGTRNVVGTVGYMTGESRQRGFHVTAEVSMPHRTRAMLDGQIHDIQRVADTIVDVKNELEGMIKAPLTDVCIAAAGRVLRTVTTRVEMAFQEETIVTGEILNDLDLMGIDQAQRDVQEDNPKYQFYCVGYSVMKYYLNGEIFSHLEGHKAKRIEEVIIVTFLPSDVVDGLYSAVERAGLSVANLTLEPIAAINLAIPENYRMLNIALVDVGAGTSDICVTKDGAIAAYGMIPHAGDELTEPIVQQFLCDFDTAEQIKIDSVSGKSVTYTDIMMIDHTIPAEEVWKLTDPVMEKITDEIAEKIKDLNGGNTVAAAFIVGGGGKVHDFCKSLSKKLEIAEERVALRGEEVMKSVEFDQKDIKKDPLLVTPIGICLNYYEQTNSFIMIKLNGERMKIYDNGHVRIIDAAIQAGFTTDELFPRRAKEIRYKFDGEERMILGDAGDGAVIRMNGEPAALNSKLRQSADIVIEPSTAGEEAKKTLSELPGLSNASLEFKINGQTIRCPKYFEVNGVIEPGSYEIKEGDVIESRNYYTVSQIAEFMDVVISEDNEILVNRVPASLDTLVYENFNVEWTIGGYDRNEDAGSDETGDERVEDSETAAPKAEEKMKLSIPIHVTVNDTPITMTGSEEYIFSDIWNYYEFNPNEGNGRSVETRVNGEKAGLAAPIHDGDKIEVFWV
ncbi:MAG: cell division protein FtsA [Lachnospiraceae bacterium]|nr:cell division protein FtsA [Lachnospiraceae bacterium]